MKRGIFAVCLGLAGWVLVASALNRLLRLLLPGYAAAEPSMQFTLGMLAARLMLGALATIAAGVITIRLAPDSPWPTRTLGIVLVVLFIPVHARLWSVFPAWYHLIFLLGLMPCVLLGARWTDPLRLRHS
jgi:hypothetical protein